MLSSSCKNLMQRHYPKSARMNGGNAQFHPRAILIGDGHADV
jgi:hypothetical protein